MDIVLVEVHAPGDFLRPHVDVDGTDEITDGTEHLAGDRADRTGGYQAYSAPLLRAGFDDDMVTAQIQSDEEVTGTVRSGQWGGFPASRRQAQGGMLEAIKFPREGAGASDKETSLPLIFFWIAASTRSLNSSTYSAGSKRLAPS